MNSIPDAFSSLAVKAIPLILTACSVASWAQTGETQGENPESEPLQLKRFAVTGSRIERSDGENMLPVIVITREEIERAGDFSTAEFLRRLNVNSFGSERPQYTNIQMGASKVDMRGLGAGRTLVLVDGRRLPASPVTTDFQDLSTLPLGYVERIEILTDGASAIYGTDAIGGVINIITRKGFRGMQVEVGEAEISHAGSKRQHGSLMAGWSNNETSLTATASWQEREILFDRDVPWRRTAGTLFSNNFTTTNPNNGRDNFNFTAIPGGCSGDGFFTIERPWSLNGQQCQYDTTASSSDEASSGNKGLMVRVDHDVNLDWQWWLDASLADSDSFGRWPPMTGASFFYGIPVPADGVNNPTNPQSPLYDPAFGPNVPVNWWHRFASMGNRDQYQDSELWDVRTGARAVLGSVELEFGVRQSRNTVKQSFLNLLDDPGIAQVIAGGDYLLQDPFATSPEVLDAYRQNFHERHEMLREELFATLSGKGPSMGGGGAWLGRGLRLQ